MAWPGAELTYCPSGIWGGWLPPAPGVGPRASGQASAGGGSTSCGRARCLYLVLDAVVQVGLVSCRPGLGAQEGPEHWNSAEEELAAAQVAARIIAGEDGLRSLIQGLIWGTRRQDGQRWPRPLPHLFLTAS